MSALDETLHRLAGETARDLAELGVRTTDEDWIQEHARTISSLSGDKRPKVFRFFRRLFGRLVRR